MRDPIIGIDLGTSNTVVAHVDATGKPVVLADDNGSRLHPSVVSFHPSGGVVVGAAAKQRKVIDPHNTIFSVKRLIGRSFRAPEVQTAITRSPFQIKEGENQMPMVATRAGEFAIPEISAIVLDYVRNIAAERLASVSVDRAVVTVPASFNDAQRSATATAGAIANLDVVRVINEPTAAALAYGHARNLNEIIAVYDFGGGTFDITILKLADQVYEVLGTSGDTFLGGDDLDERIVDRMVTKFLAENRMDLRTNEVAMMRLRAVAEQTKIELSRRSRAVVRIDEIAYGPRGKPINLHIEITRDEFVSHVADIIDRTFPVCREALALAGLGIEHIDDVILVGGTTKIPYVRDQVSRFFAKAPRTDVNPEDAVAIGAALQASALELAAPQAATTIPGFDLDREEPTSGTSSDELDREEPTSGTADELDHEEPTSEVADLALPSPADTLPDTPRPKRPTAGYGHPTTKPDTSYAVNRPGAKDVYGKLPTPDAPPAIPLARITKQLQPGDVAAAKRRTEPGMAAQPRPATPRPSTPLPRTSDTSPSMAAQRRPAPPRTPIAPPHPPITQPRTSEASPSFSGEIETHPGALLPHAMHAGEPRRDEHTGTSSFVEPLPGATAPDLILAGAADSFSDADQLGSRVDSVSDSTQGDSYTDADALAPTQAPSSFSDDDQLGRPVDSFSEADQRRAATFGDFETQEKPVPTVPAPTPQRPVPPAPPNARTLIAPPPTPHHPRHVSDFEEDQIPPASTARGLPPMPAPAPPHPAAATIPTQLMQPPATPLNATAPGPGLPFAPGAVPILPIAIRNDRQGDAPSLAPAVPAPVVLDVTPRGLGIGTVAGYCEELIRRNSRLPAAQKKLFTTSRDRQDLVRIVVCQGESRRMDNNVVIGDLILSNLPPRPRGETSIEVTFSLDASGILNVHARDALTGREQSASLDLVGGMAQHDVAASRDRIAALRR